jgi:hypothetical protein
MMAADMTVADLIKVLSQIGQLYASAGATKPADDIERLINVLRNQREDDFTAFASTAREALARLNQKPAKTTVKKYGAPAADLNIAAITYYAEQLRKAGSNQAAFDTVAKALDADDRLRLGEFTAIAHAYSGGVIKFRTLATARKDISKTFIRHARLTNKLT